MPLANADKRELPSRFPSIAWDGRSLEATLARETRRPLRLTLTDNHSVLLSFTRRRGALDLRLHRMFLHASFAVVRAIGRSLRRGGRTTAAEVRRFMNENLHLVRRGYKRLPPLHTQGRVYDLQVLFQRLNATFFDGGLRVPVTWGRGTGRARRRGLTFGSYDPVLGLIRIHPVLDSREVPVCFVESVLYHEMLHHKMGGVADKTGRTVYHTRVFREAEARYPRHREALAWEKKSLPRLLRAARQFEGR